MFRFVSVITLTFFISQSALAATIIKLVEKDGNNSTIMTDGKKARIDMGTDKEYMIIDYKKNTMVSVLAERKQVLDMSGDMPAMGGGAAPALKITFVPDGKGPVIAGYATKKYILNANGKSCGIVFGSLDAMDQPGIKQLLDAMKAFTEKQSAAMGGYVNMVDDCTRANMSFVSKSDQIGVPMLTKDQHGIKDSEIVSIKTDATLPADTFTIPADYQVISMADQMKISQQEMAKAREQMQQQMPQMEEMMKQMQQSGEFSAEELKRMQHLQEMMQRQQ